VSNINLQPSESPRWSNTTKLTVSLIFITGVIAFLIRFSGLISPLITAFIFAVIFYPVAEFIRRHTHLPWGVSVGILYIFILLTIFSMLALGGIAIINQIQDLINFLQNAILNIPMILEQISNSVFYIGPFRVDLTSFDWVMIGNELLAVVQPLLTRIGNVIGGIAGGAIGFAGSLLLSIIVSFLLVTESGGVRERLVKIEIPRYQQDLKRIGTEINHIWNAFLRGQTIVFGVRFLIYTSLLGIFGVKFFIGLALLACFANFIPYIGVAIAWITFFLVAFFQGTTAFGLEPLPYALFLMLTAWIIDNIYDNTFTPRVMGGALHIHPAAITIAALVGLNLFGLIGMILAAPLLASLRLIARYAEQKMLDQDPWENFESFIRPTQDKPFFNRCFEKISNFYKSVFQKGKSNESRK